MSRFDWDKKKNELLKKNRGISFEEIFIAIKSNKVVAIENHPNSKQYPKQKLFIIEINEYAYVVPFVEDQEKVFLKTIIPSRKATKKYLKERGRKKK